MLRRHTMLVTRPLATVTVYRRDSWWTFGKRVFGAREHILRIVTN